MRYSASLDHIQKHNLLNLLAVIVFYETLIGW